MKKTLLVILAAAALALVSCNKNEAPVSHNPGEIRFSTNIQTYTVKATDTAFENLDEVGIFAGGVINKSNVKYVVNGDALTSTTPLKWNNENNGVVPFTAYYPYSEAAQLNYPFAVAEDQSILENYKKSDLMIANTSSAPTENAVALEFKHALSKIVIDITNTTGADIVKVGVGGLQLGASVNLQTGAITPSNETPEGIFASKVADGKYQLILVPQTAKPSIGIEFSNGKTYIYELAADFTFKGGKKATATLVAAPQQEANAVEFSFQVVDWAEDSEDLSFDNPSVIDTPDNTWVVIGTLNGKTWEEPEVIDMVENEYGDWEADITYAEGEEFKLRCGDVWAGINPEWNTEVYGIGEFLDGNNYLSTAGEAKNIKFAEAGEYHLFFAPSTNWFVVTKKGGEEPQDPETAKLTVNVYNQTAWEALYLYCWYGSDLYAGEWPGILPEAEDVVVNNINYKSFVIAEYPVGVITNFILNNGTGGSGNQTADTVAPGEITKDSEVYVWLKSDLSVAFINDPTKFEPGEPEPEKWYLVGIANDWDAGIVMTAVANEEGAFEAEFTYDAQTEYGFKFNNGSWAKYYGTKSGENTPVDFTTEYLEMTLGVDGNFTMTEEQYGTYKATIYTSGEKAGRLYIIPANND